ncbi:ABC transporter substrate-binding protein [Deinococcus ruber]|uniref:ABC transporter substrate-binding protein n=1 Tax=Deinococcus ruber TaxID=1848197 RepID=A0A918C510_9DEIO|nr:ABC transporter substrate-binding protein [Deinococcus ruber]GGR07212.1 ABC transporter substrate-binding protein [Deinococcus ruber]
MFTRLLSLSLLALLPVASAAGTLVYGAPGEPVNLDPGNASDNPSLQVQTQIYDRLVNFKPGTSTPTPGLALSWTTNSTATVWTFKLRPGVKFHDGTPFNADAVVFNVNRWWDKNAEAGFRDQGKTYEIWSDLLGGYKGEAGSVLKSVSKLDALTVRFTLNKGFTAFPDVLGTDYFGIASPTAVRKAGAKFGTPASTAVGTGPFVFQSWKTGDRVTLKPNAGYWGTKSTLSSFVVRFLKDPAARLNELKAGTIDFTSSLNPDDAKSIKANSALRLVLPPAFNVGLLNLNTRNKALSNPKVRQAISMAVNKKALVAAFYGDLGHSDASLLPQALSWANSRSVPADYPYNPAQARKLLQEAGYGNGLSLDLWYPPISRSYFPTPKPVAEGIAADLSAIGIRVNLKTEDWAVYLTDRNKAPGFDMFLYGWSGDYGDPDNFYSAFYGDGGSDDTGYDPAEIQNLLVKGRAATTQAAKAKIYSQLHALTYAANVRLPIVHGVAPSAARSYVKNWITGPLGVLENVNLIRLEGKK